MLVLPTAASHVQYVIMLTELQKVLCEELKCLFVQQHQHSPTGINHTKNYGCEAYIFSALATNQQIGQKCMYIVQKCMYSVQKCVYIYCIQSTYIPWRSVCPLLIQSYTIQDEVVNLQTLRKYSVLNGNYLLILHEVFHEDNLGTKLDLLVLKITSLLSLQISI